MGRWVLLRHELPDGSWHHDLMLERSSGGIGSLLSFRLRPEQSWPPQSRFPAQRIGDHRRDYLVYEGPVSGGRGSVRRMASGTCDVRDERPEGATICLDGRWFQGAREGSAAARDGEPWVFDERPGTPAHAAADLED